jgi:PAS domain S-box-containing protein
MARINQQQSRGHSLAAIAQQRNTRARGILTTGLVFAVLVLILLIAVPPILNTRAEAIRDRAEAVQQLIGDLEQIDDQMQDMRAAARGFALTRSNVFLEQYQLAQAEIPDHFAELESLAREIQPALESQIIDMRQIARDWQSEGGDRQISLAQTGQTSAIAQELVSGTSQELFVAFRMHSNSLSNELTAIRSDLIVELNSARTLQLNVTSGLSILGFLTVGLVVFGFRQMLVMIRDLDTARQRAGHLADQVAHQLVTAETRNRQVTVLHAVAAASSRSLQRDECAQNILMAIVETLHLSGATICLSEAEDTTPTLLATLNNPELRSGRMNDRSIPSMVAVNTILRDAPDSMVQAMHSHLPLYCDPHQPESQTAESNASNIAQQIGVPLLMLPLRGRTTAIGVLVMIDPYRRLDANDLPFFSTLATEVGLVLDNTILFATAQAERQRLQTVFENSPEGIVLIDAPDGQIALLNPAAKELFGELPPNANLNDHPLAGRTHWPGGRPCPVEELPLVRTLHDGSAQYAVELVIAQPDGQRVPVLATSVPLHDDGGTLHGIVGVYQDLRRLRELERLKSDFVALVTHELRTPLTAIKGSAESLLGNGKSHDPERVRTFARIIDQQGERLQELIDNLLSLSQLEAGALRLQRQNIVLPPLIRTIMQQVRETMPDLRIQADVDTDLLPVNADPRRIEQVLQNLLDNAAKYSPNNGVITISAQTTGNRVQLSVRDQGPGIPIEERERVFDRFYQVARPTTRSVGGTGLGLAICKALVEAHGGTIWIDEAPGGGALVSFSLPALPADTPIDSSSGPATLGAPIHTNTRILVLDDDPPLQRVLERGLQDAGFSVQVCGDPQEALNTLASHTPDLMLIDVMLPGMDGFSVCQQIREWSNIPVIMLTASTSEQDIVKGFNAGADDYVTKPFRMQELLVRIDAVLRRSQQVASFGEVSLIQIENLTIDLARHQVLLGQEEIALTPTEYQILAYLARHAGQSLTHEQILQAVWGEGYSRENNYLWVHVAHLRKKIEPDPRRPRFILTERGLGYRMART